MSLRSRRFWLPVATAVLLAAAGAAVRSSLDYPVTDARFNKTVEIPTRTGVRQVAAILEKEGVIPRAWMFRAWVKLLGLSGSLRYGEYTFTGGLSLKNIIDILVSGRVTLHRLTIPEGYTLSQIAAAVEAAGLGSAADILAASRDPALLAELGIAGGSLEGFCYPDTYLLPKDLPPRKVLTRMFDRFTEVYDESLRQKAREKGLTTLETVTLASIIEKESGQSAEQPVISAVFHNRLKQGIPLMADPVVIYGLESFSGNLRRADLVRPGPWNVYLNKGLPPGPISNPGLSALKAALHPAEVDFLFFVSKNNGTHYFSKTLDEHNTAVNTYQRAKN